MSSPKSSLRGPLQIKGEHDDSPTSAAPSHIPRTTWPSVVVISDSDDDDTGNTGNTSSRPKSQNKRSQGSLSGARPPKRTKERTGGTMTPTSAFPNDRQRFGDENVPLQGEAHAFQRGLREAEMGPERNGQFGQQDRRNNNAPPNASTPTRNPGAVYSPEFLSAQVDLREARELAATLQSEVDSLKADVQEKDERLKRLMSADTELYKTKISLMTEQSALEKSRNAVADLEKKLGARDSAVEDRERDMEQLRAKVKVLETDTSTQTSRLEKLQQRNRVLSEEKMGLSNKVHSLEAEIEAREAALQTSQEESQALSRDKEELCGKVQALETTIASKESSLKTSQEKYQTLHQANEALSREKEELHGKVQRLEKADTEARDSAFETWQEQNRNLSLEKEDLTAKVQALDAAIASRESSLKTSQERIQALSRANEALSKEKEELASKAADTTAANHPAERSAAIAKHAAETSGLRDRAQRAETELSAAQATIAGLEQERERAKAGAAGAGVFGRQQDPEFATWALAICDRVRTNIAERQKRFDEELEALRPDGM